MSQDSAYHPAAQALQRITAVAVIGMLGVGLWMAGLPLGFTKLHAYNWHKWVGLAVLVLTVGRLLWRWRHPPPPLPGTIVRWQAVLAPIAHWALLVLLLAMPISGWFMSSAAGVSVIWFGILPLPDLVPRDEALFEALKTTHYVLLRLLITVLILHVAALMLAPLPSLAGPQDPWTVDPSSLASAHRHQDRHASGFHKQPRCRFAEPNFLDVQKFPEARFVTTSISGSGERYEARGKLTLRDVTRDVVLPFTLTIVDDPAAPGRQRGTARGRLIIKRLDYGVGQNEWAATGQVANEVTIDLNVVAGRAK